jgi:hypothetical protein
LKHYTLTFNVKAGGLAGLQWKILMKVAMRQKLLDAPMKYSAARSRRHASRLGTTAALWAQGAPPPDFSLKFET